MLFSVPLLKLTLAKKLFLAFRNGLPARGEFCKQIFAPTEKLVPWQCLVHWVQANASFKNFPMKTKI
jgi:hypothetical protein